MNTFIKHILILVLCCTGLLSCTSARWTVIDESAVDRSESTIVNQKEFLETNTAVTPENPVLIYYVVAKTTYEYPEKVLLQRTVQDYKLRPFIVAFGMAGAGIGFYAANSSSVLGTRTTAKTISLNTLSGILGLASILNLKPSGEPEPTGEERYLKKTGIQIETDTIEVKETTTRYADISVQYGDRIIMQEQSRALKQNRLEIDLGTALNSLNIKDPSPDKVMVKVVFGDSTMHKQYALNQILQPFANVTTPITLLHTAPEKEPENVIAELKKGSQLQIVEQQNDWFKVLYGISENYIPKEEAEIVWRSSEFARESEVFAVPRVPFGNIDVEANIPALKPVDRNAYGLIIANENYGAEQPLREYALRDALLTETYLRNALGFPSENIFQIYDSKSSDEILDQIKELRASANDSSKIVVYINGFGLMENKNGNHNFKLLLGEPQDSLDYPAINLAAIFEQLAQAAPAKTTIFADMDFKTASPDSLLSKRDFLLDNPFRNLAEIITNSNPESAVMFSALPDQNAGLYMDGANEDKHHNIFTYFLAEAIKERITTLDEIFQYLERNVNFTSRKIYDRAQDPVLYGNRQLDLIE